MKSVSILTSPVKKDEISISEIRELENKLEEFDRQRKIKLEEIDRQRSEIITKLSHLKNRRSELITLSWRDEIRNCLIDIDGNNILATPRSIIDCIVYRNGVELTRNIRVMVSTTLSAMYREKELGRIDKGGYNKFYYGNKELFNSDLKTLKPKYGKMIA